MSRVKSTVCVAGVGSLEGPAAMQDIANPSQIGRISINLRTLFISVKGDDCKTILFKWIDGCWAASIGVTETGIEADALFGAAQGTSRRANPFMTV